MEAFQSFQPVIEFVDVLLMTVVRFPGGLDVLTVTGLSFNPLTRQWSTSSDLSINYAVTAIKPDPEDDIDDEFDSFFKAG
jgi:hypothetical protein